MQVKDLDVGKSCRTVSGKYYKHYTNYNFHNELGVACSPDFEEEIEEVFDCMPTLMEGEDFTLLSKISKIFPNETLIFQTYKGLRFLVRMENYRITIPFMFQSTDKRVGTGIGRWTAASGKIVEQMLKAWVMYITNEDQPKLVIDCMTNKLTIPCQ